MNGPGFAVRWARKFGCPPENRKNETCDTGVKIEQLAVNRVRSEVALLNRFWEPGLRQCNCGKAICAESWGRVPKRQSSTDFVHLYSFISLVGDPMAGLTGHAAIGNRQAYGARRLLPTG